MGKVSWGVVARTVSDNSANSELQQMRSKLTAKTQGRRRKLEGGREKKVPTGGGSIKEKSGNRKGNGKQGNLLEGDGPTEKYKIVSEKQKTSRRGTWVLSPKQKLKGIV